jgi:hypothetical protein
VRAAVRTPVRVRATVGLAATALVVVVAGCTTEPSGGAPQLVKTGENQVQAYVQQLPPPPPRAYHYPRQVVLAFLHANASYAFDPAAVKQFLVPSLRAKWHPGPVTVLSSIGKPPPPGVPVHSQQDAASAAGHASVEFTGQRLAILSQTGQYQFSPSTGIYAFSLQKVDGVWLISALPDPDSLLVTQDDFERVYQARNLFFFARSSPSNNLVPDPVYAAGALNTNLASKLVQGLFSDQDGWLSGATETAFLPGTRLLGITISGQTAVVDLGGTAVDATTDRQQAMAEQLQATLAYSPPLASLVQLEINGHMADTTQPANLIGDVPRGPLVYRSGLNYITEGLGSNPRSLGPAEFGAAGITAIAMSPPAPAPAAGRVAVATQDGNGCQVYVLTAPLPGQPTAAYHIVRLSASGGGCTSLSWDNNGYLWVTAGHKIWVLKGSDTRPRAVALPADLVSRGQPAPQIIALRMAPDAVRAALLIKPAAGHGGPNSLVLAAVSENGNQVSLGSAVPTGTGLRDPQAMSWFSPYDLMVLDKSGIGESVISEVSLAGGAAERLGSAPAGAVSLTTDGATIVVGTSDGEILTSPPTRTTWAKRATGAIPGAIPIYPG